MRGKPLSRGPLDTIINTNGSICLPGAKGPGLSVTTTTLVTRLQSLASRSLHMAARSAQIDPQMVLDSAFVPAKQQHRGGLSLFDEFPAAPRRLREASVKQPWWHHGSTKQPWRRRGGSVDISLHNLSSNPSPYPNPKIETTHGCAERITDSLRKHPQGSCGCTEGL